VLNRKREKARRAWSVACLRAFDSRKLPAFAVRAGGDPWGEEMEIYDRRAAAELFEERFAPVLLVC
jgi:hypothetical protein